MSSQRLDSCETLAAGLNLLSVNCVGSAAEAMDLDAMIAACCRQDSVSTCLGIVYNKPKKPSYPRHPKPRSRH